MQRLSKLVWVAGALIAAAGPALAAAEAEAPYQKNLISVATVSRHGAFATANCLVWVNAEGFGVGPAQLDGFHGLSMNINPKPLPTETVQQPTTFDSSFAGMKARFPMAPAWVLGAVQKNRAAIEAGCAGDHEGPFKVYTITARDAHG
ncbi:hypothetical protein [Phenylobacterium sp.]|uniref:hypothetical protein n=1 Tax=Phenylobacterium sp. TaxID=1871053 RepID=UPI0011FA24E7|nr:hypothetical protein [Phenylobacterium sp.]THD54555.1 MAG: hypothetical protein E8A12_16990 [Phenylobacterium sp.]